MSIRDDREFYLFMDMRTENQWASFNMTPKKWVAATHDYNKRLEALNMTRHHQTIAKMPKALMEMLGDVETKIANRILKNDFVSVRSNTDGFWRKHCAAVPLVKAQESLTTNNSGKPRKVATCSRCRMIMYPGPPGSQENHRKGYCSDGVRPSMKGDTPPDWPQPQGIFELGTKFNPLNLLASLRDLYTQIVIQNGTGGDFAMEYQAFWRLLHNRLTVAADGHHLFKLYDLNLPSSTPPELIVEQDGSRYMRVDYLQSSE